MSVLLATILIRLVQPISGQNSIKWSGSGTAVSEAQRNFHILLITGDRNVNGLPPKCLTDRVNDLDGRQIDQGRYREAIDNLIRFGMPF